MPELSRTHDVLLESSVHLAAMHGPFNHPADLLITLMLMSGILSVLSTPQNLRLLACDHALAN